MKYRKWDSKTKAKIVLEELQNKIPLAEFCNRHQITQSQYYYWFNEFQTKSHEICDFDHNSITFPHSPITIALLFLTLREQTPSLKVLTLFPHAGG